MANPPTRAAPAAPKVAPASREAIPPGSADPPGTSAVCAVDAELCAVSCETDRIDEPLNSCSSICLAEGNPGILGLSPRRSEVGCCRFGAPFLSAALAFFIASKTLPINSPLELHAKSQETFRDPYYRCSTGTGVTVSASLSA